MNTNLYWAVLIVLLVLIMLLSFNLCREGLKINPKKCHGRCAKYFLGPKYYFATGSPPGVGFDNIHMTN